MSACPSSLPWGPSLGAGAVQEDDHETSLEDSEIGLSELNCLEPRS